jgi:hypothetical protein
MEGSFIKGSGYRQSKLDYHSSNFDLGVVRRIHRRRVQVGATVSSPGQSARRALSNGLGSPRGSAFAELLAG